MSDKIMINLGKNGMCGLIAQADTTITLSDWFESAVDRVFVAKFADYCAYMAMHGREGYSNTEFSMAHKIMEMLTVGELSITYEEALKVINSCYSVFIRDIGTLLIKEACLFARHDSDWCEFSIHVSLPVVLTKYFGMVNVIGYENVSDVREFVNLTLASEFDTLIKKDSLIDLLISRDDISMSDVTLTKGTQLATLLSAGVAYLEMSNRNIKGRVVGI